MCKHSFNRFNGLVTIRFLYDCCCCTFFYPSTICNSSDNWADDISAPHIGSIGSIWSKNKYNQFAWLLHSHRTWFEPNSQCSNKTLPTNPFIWFGEIISEKAIKYFIFLEYVWGSSSIGFRDKNGFNSIGVRFPENTVITRWGQY